MASPEIINRRPDQDDTEVDVLSPLRFGVRDVDTRADLSSIYTLVSYGDGVYDPSVGQLPADSDVLEGADVDFYFSTFSDATPVAEPRNPVDQSLEVVSLDDVYRLEKNDLDGTLQEGIAHLTASVEDARPITLKAKFNLTNVNVDTFSYVTFSGFTGVLMGAAYWPENTGVFLFFVDDGTKKVVVAGPATDTSGTRTVETAVVFDWSAEAYEYSIIIDPSVFGRKVWVYATDSTGAETLLHEFSLDSLNEFLSGTRIGNRDAGTSSDVTFLVGGDFPDMGDYIDIYEFSVLDFGLVLLVNGQPTGACIRQLRPTESIFLYGPDGPSEWRTFGSGVVEQTAVATKITSDGGGDYFQRDEPDLSSGEWLVMGRFAAANSIHPGAYETGMALVIDDGTRKFSVTLLDDFSRNLVGIEEADATDDSTVEGYKLTGSAVDWEEAFNFTLLGSSSRDELKLFVDSDVDAEVTHTYTASGYPASGGTPGVSVGFVDSDPSLSGEFFLAHLWVLPFCTFYEAVEATYPETQGWTRANSGGSARSLVSDALRVTDDTVGEYDIYYLTDSTFDFTSGAAAVARFKLLTWVDGEGAYSPIRTEIGPVMAIRADTGVSVQLFFTQDEEGVFYAYLPGGNSDIGEVLAQSSRGRLISARVDLTEARVFFLDVKPTQWVRLYVDFEPEPVIEIPWTTYTGVVRSDPTNMPASAVVALGSLGENAGVDGYFDFFRASIGRGYDFLLAPKVDGDTLLNSIYGSLTSILIDVQDED